MPNLDVRITADLHLDAVLALCAAVGWAAYPHRPGTIAAGGRSGALPASPGTSSAALISVSRRRC